MRRPRLSTSGFSAGLAAITQETAEEHGARLLTAAGNSDVDNRSQVAALEARLAQDGVRPEPDHRYIDDGYTFAIRHNSSARASVAAALFISDRLSAPSIRSRTSSPSPTGSR